MIGETIGNFRVVARIGAGGMGEVFLAEQKNIETKVAIKVLRPEISLDRQHVDRFFNEARAVSRIKHAGTVKIFDVGHHTTGHAYLVMEFLEGETLAARIQRLGNLPLVQIADIGRQTCGVLEATHAAGITHRDLKPDNIFLVPDSELASHERVKILDFGIAKLTGTMNANSPRTVGTMGTPAYMAPEQWGDAAKVDWRADIYSLGCLTFEMATGRPPFVSSNFAEACGKHLAEAPPKLRSLVPSAPEVLEVMLDAMLAKSAYARPPLRDIAKTFEQLGAGLAHSLDATLPPGPRPSREQVAATIAPDAATRAPAVHQPTPIHQQTPQHHATPQHQTPQHQTPQHAQVAPAPPVVPVPNQTTLSSATGAADVPPKKSRAAIYAIGGVVVVGGGIAALVAGMGGVQSTSAPPVVPLKVPDVPRATETPDAARAIDAPVLTIASRVNATFVEALGGVLAMPKQVTRGQYKAYLDTLDSSGVAKAKPLRDWSDDRSEEPVSWVTFEQARDLCKAIDARLATTTEWLSASKGGWRIGPETANEVVFRDWTATITPDGLAIVLGGTSKMTAPARVAAIKNPLSKPTMESAGPNPPAEAIAAATIGIRCVK